MPVIHVQFSLASALIALIGGACQVDHSPQTVSEGATSKDPAATLFQHQRVTELRIDLPEHAMTQLADRPRRWVLSGVRYGPVTLDDVGIHIKGHRSLRSWAEKPSFKLNFGKHHAKQRLLGMRKLVLNAMVEDPTMIREALAYKLHHLNGVPSPRTGYVRLFIDDADFGLYLAVEPYTRRMMGRYGATKAGALYEGEYGCDVVPDDAPRMDLKSGKDPKRSAIRRLSTAAQSDLSALFKGDGATLDRSEFLAYLAVSTVIADFDGYRHAHNYYLHWERERDRWRMLPWGLDQTFVRTKMSIYDINGHLARKCFRDEACRTGYLVAIRAASARLEQLRNDGAVESLIGLTRKHADSDPRTPFSTATRRRSLRKLSQFITDRVSWLRAETACLDNPRDADRDGYGCVMDCDDDDGSVHPGAEETCDGVDNDCSGLADDAPACPCTAHVAGGETYQLCNEPRNWNEAAAYCKGAGLQLAQFKDKAQSKSVQRATQKIDKTEWWIGLNDRGEEGTFRWSDGSAPAFVRWAKKEPDNYACGQNCVVLRSSNSGKWRDMHCGSMRPFVCIEKSATTRKKSWARHSGPPSIRDSSGR